MSSKKKNSRITGGCEGTTHLLILENGEGPLKLGGRRRREEGTP